MIHSISTTVFLIKTLFIWILIFNNLNCELFLFFWFLIIFLDLIHVSTKSVVFRMWDSNMKGGRPCIIRFKVTYKMLQIQFKRAPKISLGMSLGSKPFGMASFSYLNNLCTRLHFPTQLHLSMNIKIIQFSFH